MIPRDTFHFGLSNRKRTELVVWVLIRWSYVARKRLMRLERLLHNQAVTYFAAQTITLSEQCYEEQGLRRYWKYYLAAAGL